MKRPSKKIMVIAPHPDDETLGCGGTLLRYAAAGNELHWIIVTKMDESSAIFRERVESRKNEIKRVSQAYGFHQVHCFDFLTTQLDSLPKSDLIARFSAVFDRVKPDELLLPFPGDIHSDHEIVFECASASAKCFRHPSISRILAYEVLSETDYGISPVKSTFNPTVFVDVSTYIDQKIEIMKIYLNEMGAFPFPRSEEALLALSRVRGSASGFHHAEGFMLLRERQPLESPK